MSYIKESLGQDEEIKFRFRFHWWIKVQIVVVYMASPILAAIFYSYLGTVSLLLLLIGVIHHLHYKTIEMGATNKRIILKEGIIARRTEEQILAKIETVEINQGILGRLLGYGDVNVTGTGGSPLVFQDIDDPIAVKKSIDSLLYSS